MASAEFDEGDQMRIVFSESAEVIVDVAQSMVLVQCEPSR